MVALVFQLPVVKVVLLLQIEEVVVVGVSYFLVVAVGMLARDARSQGSLPATSAQS